MNKVYMLFGILGFLEFSFASYSFKGFSMFAICLLIGTSYSAKKMTFKEFFSYILPTHFSAKEKSK